MLAIFLSLNSFWNFLLIFVKSQALLKAQLDKKTLNFRFKCLTDKLHDCSGLPEENVIWVLSFSNW